MEDVLEPQVLQVTHANPAKDAFLPVAPWTTPRVDAERTPHRGWRSRRQMADLVTGPAEGGTSEDLVRTEFVEDSASVSPDGRWLAYRTTRSGRGEIWVQATTGSAPVRVSQNGGREPVWSRDGRELYYLEGNKMIALGVRPGQEFTFASPEVLFDQPYFHGFELRPPVVLSSTSCEATTLERDGRFVDDPASG